MNPGSLTLNDHLDRLQSAPGVPHGLSAILLTLADTVRDVAHAVRRGQLAANLAGSTGSVNVQGEVVQKLDDYTNARFSQALLDSPYVAAIASEEEQDVMTAARTLGASANGSGSDAAGYFVAFDPLDGSSNIDTNASVGTIFSILAMPEGGLPPGRLWPEGEPVAAGYAIYGSATVFVYSARDGVHGFTLDPDTSSFRLSHPAMQCPAQGKIYSANEGYSALWSARQRALVDGYKQAGADPKQSLSLRYIGSLIADFHRTLMKGGIFMYPADAKNPRGKLRFLYEAAPLALLAEQAGGAATDGAMRILDWEPTTLHERVPLFIGSREMVAHATRFLNESSEVF